MSKIYKPIVYLNTRETATVINKPEDIDNIKNHEWFSFNCIKCGASVSIAKRSDKDRIQRYKTLLCQPCYAKYIKTILYGDQNYTNKEKFKETWKNKSQEEKDEISSRRVKTLNELYGGPGAKSSIIKAKMEKTNLEKYNTTETFANKEVIEKCRKTMNERYGVDYTGQSQELLEKMKKTCCERYGKQYYNNRTKAKETYVNKSQEEKDEIVNKMFKTMNERYGGLCMTSPIIKAKVESTNMKKYNAISYFGSEQYRKDRLNHPEWSHYTYDNIGFDSAWELILWIYAKDHNEEIIKEPIMFTYSFGNKNDRKYFPDFLYKGKLIEIKGNHFYEDGDLYKRMICPFNYYKGKQLTEEEKKYMDDLYEAKHQCGLKNGVEFWGNKEIQPYIDYVNDKYGLGYIVQFKNKNIGPYIY